MPVSPLALRAWSYQDLIDDCEEFDDPSRCGRVLPENDRACALDQGHDDDCAPASACCRGCGRAGWHKFGCALEGRQQVQLSMIEQRDDPQ